MSFEELEHTADFLFRCKGSTIGELFSESAAAMFSVMFEHRGEKNIQKEIRLSSDSPENLLLDFLEELLFISETESIVFSKAEVEMTTDNSLYAKAFGETFDMTLHMGGTEIKGISRSGVNIQNNNGTYEVSIIFDV